MQGYERNMLVRAVTAMVGRLPSRDAKPPPAPRGVRVVVIREGFYVNRAPAVSGEVVTVPAELARDLIARGHVEYVP